MAQEPEPSATDSPDVSPEKLEEVAKRIERVVDRLLSDNEEGEFACPLFYEDYTGVVGVRKCDDFPRDKAVIWEYRSHGDYPDSFAEHTRGDTWQTIVKGNRQYPRLDPSAPSTIRLRWIVPPPAMRGDYGYVNHRRHVTGNANALKGVKEPSLNVLLEYLEKLL